MALSAYDVDPLSWFTGQLVPLVFAGVTFTYGIALSIATWVQVGNPRLQPLGVLIATLACVFVHVMTRPLRPRIGWGTGAIAMGMAAVGFLVSAVGYYRIDFAIEVWWAPFAMAFVLISLAPYLPAPTLVALGMGSIAVTAPVAYFIISREDLSWGPVTTVLIIITPTIAGVIATATFSYLVVSRMQPLIDKRSETLVSTGTGLARETEEAERVRLAQLTARAVPFLESIAETGVVTASERALAGQLARRLRDDLVTQSNLTWLDSVAQGSRIVVIDPLRLANKMRGPQRTALRAFLQAILDTPGTDSGSLLIELRRGEDGATAVGVSLDRELPEGRRIMHLAPYYVTLGTAVENLKWSRDRFLKLTFNLPDS